MSFIEDLDGKGLFQDPKYKKYNEIVTFKDEKSAKRSIEKLEKEFHQAKTKAKKLRIARVAQYSANRALASTKNPRLSDAQAKERTKVGKVYNQSAKRLWKEYGK